MSIHFRVIFAAIVLGLLVLVPQTTFWTRGPASTASETQLEVIAEIDVSAGPWNLLVDGSRDQVYVARKSNRFAIIDGQTNEVIHDDQPDLDRPRSLALNDEEGRIYLSASGFGGIAEYDVTSGARVATIDSDNDESKLAFDPFRRRLYVAGGNGIEIFDPGGNLLASDGSSYFTDVAFDPSTGRLFAIREDSENARFGVELNTVDGSVVRELGKRASAVTVDSDRGIVYGIGVDGLWMLDEATNQITNIEPSIPFTPQSIWDMTVDASTGCIYAVERFFEGSSADGEVFVLSSSGELLDSLSTGADLWSVDVNSESGRLYIADPGGGGRVLVLEALSQPELCAPSAENTQPTLSPSPSQPPSATPAALPSTGGRR